MSTLPPPLPVTPAAARRFHRRALLLDSPAPDLATALAHHGYIQIDPINVCGRMHDLIARNRVAGYREGDLMRHLHGTDKPLPAHARVAFEHHLPTAHTLVAFPLDAWPHLIAANLARTRRTGAWSGRLTPREQKLAPSLLAAVAERGPLNSDAFDDPRSARKVWGSATLAKATLQKLFFHGRLLIAQRGEGNRRYYDLPERVLPAGVLKLSMPTKKETARWEALLKLRQRRLVMLKRDELPLVDDMVQPVKIEGCPMLYCLREDVPIFDAAVGANASPAASLLLAPLDPLIYDRRVTSALWGFDYTWEVYTPPHKRTRGYYALPMLADLDLVGHVDPKADRVAKKLRVMGRSVRRGNSASPAIKALAAFLSLKG
ncbi:MAG: hypothetical protein JWM32_2923 [Verrucomicrobia bacterium]|nr:hypothetical protein [Verrucomicrobiota bacterium]